MPTSEDFSGDTVGCPFQCKAGSFGSTSYETSESCTGACPRGHYCPGECRSPRGGSMPRLPLLTRTRAGTKPRMHAHTSTHKP
eukprot:4316419-Pleurochrysis_carterae.AAC.1